MITSMILEIRLGKGIRRSVIWKKIEKRDFLKT